MARTDTITATAALAMASVFLALSPGLASSQEGGSVPAAVTGAHESHDAHMASAMAGMSDPLEDIVVEFELADRDGNLVSLSDFRGRYVLLGFGFTHCPAVCPLMVLNMGKALRDSEVEGAGIFVSVDTERDSAAITDDST